MSESKQYRVMIVDDSETDRFVHSKLLQHYNISSDIYVFETGRDALNYLKENKKEVDKLPEVILLDIMMPEMSGFDFMVYFENIKDTLECKPLIFMLSSTDDENDLRRVRNNPYVMKLLKKPFSPEAFKRALSEL